MCVCVFPVTQTSTAEAQFSTTNSISNIPFLSFFQAVLERMGVSRMVVGHTPQHRHGINRQDDVAHATEFQKVAAAVISYLLHSNSLTISVPLVERRGELIQV